MKAFIAAVVLGAVVVSVPVSAQQPPATAAQAPPAAAAPAPAKPPVATFPQGAHFAYINIQLIAAESAEGKASTAKIEGLRAKKAGELNDRNKQVEANQAKMRSAVLSEDVRAQIQRDLDKAQVEIQRMTQDAQAELQELQNELQMDFQRKLGPVIQAVAKEKGIHFLFSQADSGLVWADPGLDLTAEVIARFDAAYAPIKPAAPAAAPKK